MARILVVDDDVSFRNTAAIALRRQGYEVEVAGSAEEAASLSRGDAFDVVFTDLRLPGASGLDLLESLQRDAPDTRVVVTASLGSISDAVEAMQSGACNYLTKPVAEGDLVSAARAAVEPRAGLSTQRRSAARSEPAPGSRPAILGQSRQIRELLELVDKVAATESTALISGETGTGKELVGRAIHHASRRRGRVFCAVNSAAFPETLLESELFGHRRGSFTGASSSKKGLFESADRGTVFLDEVAEMPLSMQAKLLRFLQTGEIRPVGSETTRCVDVRLVAATNKSLEQEVEAGRFREDLYYRLAVIPIHVPPLRERAGDVPLLAAHFVRGFAARLGKRVEGIEPAALDLLCSWSWPGNVRELENCMERCVALCQSERISLDDLPVRMRERRAATRVEGLESLEMVERLHILSTLEKVGWNRKKAAEVLRISTTTLWRRLKEFGVEESRAGGARIAQG